MDRQALQYATPQFFERILLSVIRNKWGWIVFAAGLLPVYFLSRQMSSQIYRFGVSVNSIQLSQLSSNAFAILVGFLAGFVIVLLLFLFKRFRAVTIALIALFVVFLILTPGIGTTVTPVSGALAFIIGLGVASALFFPRSGRGGLPHTDFGSAQWADFDHLRNNGLFNEKGFWLGGFPIPRQYRAGESAEAELRYGGDRHLLTVAPTRAGKGVSAIIPNLLTYPGSVLVIDPKGENALTTAVARHKMGQQVHILDPWGIVAPRFRIPAAKFNPLDWLVNDDPDLNENAMLLADALIVKSEGGKDRFWDEEAKALLMGVILYVATEEAEKTQRHLGRVRDLLMLDGDGLKELFGNMYNAKNAVVASTGARSMQKNAELLSNVLASTQAQTHFLDSPRIRESLGKSDFHFEHLKPRPTTIYLVLPADRLNAFGRWLRLLIQQAITINARNITERPDHAVLFMLDEMPALGHLTMVEQAYGLMAGFGMQLWGIVQDLSQLKRIYGDGWETFVSNSGVLQYFGSRDRMSAEYFSKLCGVTTLLTLSETFSSAVSRAFGGNSGSSTDTTSTTKSKSQRPLAYPDELMTLPADRQLVLIENLNPVNARKIKWYEHPALAPLGINLHQLPKGRAEEASRAVEAPPSRDPHTHNTSTRPAHLQTEQSRASGRSS